ncbi:MAG: hypothetical protein CM15mP68_7860 [Pseudomonadota bacterium]|nr:MAG: hypothetical protein CM15mP68_7860 [Pseudomonadota bacterium]
MCRPLQLCGERPRRDVAGWSEVGVASTKAFTAQLANLLLLAILLGRRRGLSANTEQTLVKGLHALPDAVQSVPCLDDAINELAKQFIEKHHALFLGRGSLYQSLWRVR